MLKINHYYFKIKSNITLELIINNYGNNNKSS